MKTKCRRCPSDIRLSAKAAVKQRSLKVADGVSLPPLQWEHGFTQTRTGAMIHSVEIEGYRGLKRLTMSGLGRVNLLVGTNNSGKTSVLEALYLVKAQRDLSALKKILDGRGEQLFDGTENIGLYVNHLFFNHELTDGSKFCISAN